MKSKKYTLYILPFVALFFLMMAVVTVINNYRITESMQGATGTIVKVYRGGKDTTYAVKFSNSSGDEIETQAYSKLWGLLDYKSGESVKILYDPSNPNKVELDSFKDRWLVTLVYVFLEIALAGLAIIKCKMLAKSAPP